MKTKLITAAQPSGKLHIGNYFGAFKRLREYQESHDSYVFIADLHALTTVHEKEKLEEFTKELMITFLAIGLDPKKVTLYRQSRIQEVVELSAYFNSLITVPYLMRAHAYKDAVEKGKEVNNATFNYPVLMAADILISDAEIVPVGQDNKQHLEITREIARKFNTQYGETFTEPKELIEESTGIVLGIDGQKMSKSYGNTIPLFAEREELEKIVMTIPTDSKGIEEPKDTESILFKIHELILDEDRKKKLKEQYLTPGLSYKEAKLNLLEDLDNFIKPMREKKKELEKNFSRVEKIFKKGEKKMKKIAEKRIAEIRKKVGI